jgi:hypothetical protein
MHGTTIYRVWRVPRVRTMMPHLGFDQNHHTKRPDGFHQCRGNLVDEAFLHLPRSA